MGYTTDFEGRLEIDPPLNEKEVEYLKKFNETRRMDREKGPYFVGGSGFAGQGRDADIRDFNCPPDGQPGLWCNLTPTDDGTALVWDGGEKAYSMELWAQYLIDHFLRPNAIAYKLSQKAAENGVQDVPVEQQLNGDSPLLFLQANHTINGCLHAQGEDMGDIWSLVVNDNQISVKDGHVDYEKPKGNVIDSKVEREGLDFKP